MAEQCFRFVRLLLIIAFSPEQTSLFPLKYSCSTNSDAFACSGVFQFISGVTQSFGEIYLWNILVHIYLSKPNYSKEFATELVKNGIFSETMGMRFQTYCKSVWKIIV